MKVEIRFSMDGAGFADNLRLEIRDVLNEAGDILYKQYSRQYTSNRGIEQMNSLQDSNGNTIGHVILRPKEE